MLVCFLCKAAKIPYYPPLSLSISLSHTHTHCFITNFDTHFMIVSSFREPNHPINYAFDKHKQLLRPLSACWNKTRLAILNTSPSCYITPQPFRVRSEVERSSGTLRLHQSDWGCKQRVPLYRTHTHGWRKLALAL